MQEKLELFKRPLLLRSVEPIVLIKFIPLEKSFFLISGRLFQNIHRIIQWRQQAIFYWFCRLGNQLETKKSTMSTISFKKR